MNYDVTHEHCHNRQKREKHKPIDLRWVIHSHNIAHAIGLSSINIYMLSFKQFISEGKFLFGINHLDRGANTEITRLADLLGYRVIEGGSHIKIVDPKTGNLVTTVSRGTTTSHPGRMRTALNDISSHQREVGGLDASQHTIKTVKKEMTSNPKASGLRALGATTLAGTGTLLGSALTQGVQAGTNVIGMAGLPPAPKERMEIEKNFGSDIGIGFDLSPEGELMGSPEGFKAVSQRKKQGINFPSMFDEEEEEE